MKTMSEVESGVSTANMNLTISGSVTNNWNIQLGNVLQGERSDTGTSSAAGSNVLQVGTSNRMKRKANWKVQLEGPVGWKVQLVEMSILVITFS